MKIHRELPVEANSIQVETSMAFKISFAVGGSLFRRTWRLRSSHRYKLGRRVRPGRSSTDPSTSNGSSERVSLASLAQILGSWLGEWGNLFLQPRREQVFAHRSRRQSSSRRCFDQMERVWQKIDNQTPADSSRRNFSVSNPRF